MSPLAPGPTTTGLAPDPAVPARDLLLDPGWAAAALADGLGQDARLDVVGTERGRVKYRVGESLRVTYRLRLADGRRVTASARTFPDGDRAARALGPPPPAADGVRAGWCDRRTATAWWVYPHDRRLRGLVALDGASPALPGLVPGLVPGEARAELVTLSAGSAAVLRVTDGSGVVRGFAKVFAPGTVPVLRLAALYRLVGSRFAGSQERVRVPRVLVADPARDLLVLDPVPGVPWATLDQRASRDAVAALGRCVAHVHATAAAGCDLPPFVRTEPRRVLRSAEVVARARPDVAATVLGLAAALLGDPPAPVRPVLLHGDCHQGNLLAGPHGVSLIDLDQAGLGPAAADVGSVLARLLVAGLVGATAPADGGGLAAAFLGGYAQVRPLPSAPELAWHVAAALLVEGALRAVNRVHQPELARLAEVVDLAHRTRTGGPPA